MTHTVPTEVKKVGFEASFFSIIRIVSAHRKFWGPQEALINDAFFG